MNSVLDAAELDRESVDLLQEVMGEVRAEHPEYFTPSAGQPESQAKAQANGKAARPFPNGDNGRDARSGRFVKGNPGGPGNPTFRKLAAARRALIEAVTHHDLKALAAALLKQALGGDHEAARILLSYVVGKPVNAVDPDGADEDEWRRRDAQETRDLLASISSAFQAQAAEARPSEGG
jgi:hypothetical protein